VESAVADGARIVSIQDLARRDAHLYRGWLNVVKANPESEELED
jgi:hypothetical protein